MTNPLTKTQQDLGARLRDVRVARNLTQAQVATLAEVDVSTVSRVEAGLLGIGAAYLRVANALGVTFEVNPEVTAS